MSLSQYYYAKTLVKRGKIKLIFRNEKMVEFEADCGKNVYNIQYFKKTDRWSCTCIGFSAYLVGKDCSHIISAKMFLKNEKKTN